MMLALLRTEGRSIKHNKWMSGLKRVSYTVFTGAHHVNTIDRVTVCHEVKHPMIHSGLAEVKDGLSSQKNNNVFVALRELLMYSVAGVSCCLKILLMSRPLNNSINLTFIY